MKTSTLTLYQSGGSPNSRRVRFYLAEKGICVSQVPVDLGAKEQFSEAYGAINPSRVVPTLVLEDGTSIGEVPVIIRYLEELHPNPPLLGATPKERARIGMWERRMEQEGFAAVMEAVRNAVPGLKSHALAGPHGYEQIPELAERSRLRVQNFYADLERRLDAEPFVAGGSFSVADITAAVTVDFATKALGLGIPAQNAASWRWYGVVAERPGFAA